MAVCSLRRLRVSVAAALVLVSTLASCASSTPFCEGVTSIAGFTMQFSQGLDNFSETQYATLQRETFDARKSVNHAAVEFPKSEEASDLAKKINVFISSMEDIDWDMSVAITDENAVNAALSLGSPQSLTQANTVESLLISECGLPSTVVNAGQTVETLPGPSIPSPTQTDPPTNTINDTSQNDALGATVASLFNLNISPAQSSCLGTALQGVVDVSASNANLAQYQSQFQKAFDQCSIDFTVPTN